MADYRTASADAGSHRGRAASLPDGPGPGRFHDQPLLGCRPGHGNGFEPRKLNHHCADGRPPSRQAGSHGGSLEIAAHFPDDGGVDEAVAAVGEQILGPTDVLPREVQLSRGFAAACARPAQPVVQFNSLRLHGVEELLQLVVTGGQFRLHAAVREVGEARVADHVAGVACYHKAAGVAVGESWVLRLLVVSKASSLSMMSSQRPSPC